MINFDIKSIFTYGHSCLNQTLNKAQFGPFIKAVQFKKVNEFVLLSKCYVGTT